MAISGQTFTGAGSPASATWNGKDSSGNYVAPGSYTATLTASKCNGSCSDTKSATVQVECDLALTNPTATPTEFDPSAGGSTTIGATVSTVVPYTWTVTVGGKTLPGSGPLAGVVWDGTDSSGNIVKPDLYPATITVTTANGCSKSETVQVRVVEGPKSCPLKPTFRSTVNVASGNLTHSQDLFAAKGGPLATVVSFTYESLASLPGVLGKGWNHNYEIAVIDNGNGTLLFREGSGKRLYTLSGSSYVSQFGDTSTLVKNADGTFIVTELDGLSNNFDAAGRIVSRSDRNGNSLTYTYTDGKLTGITDAAGRATTFAYDANNKLASISAPNGSNFTFTYTGTSLTAVNHPDGGSWSYTYDSDGFLLTKTDPGGNTVTYTYDDKHRVLTGSIAGGTAKSLTYPQSTNAVRNTTFTEEDGGNWIYTYDTSKGTLTSKTDPLGNTTSFTYDANRNMLTKTEPVVGTTTYTYDANHNMLTTTDPLGNATTYTYNSRGQVLTTSGPQGTTTSTYDVSGNLLTTTDPAGATTTYEYDARGNMARITNAKNQITTMTYDTAGLLASTTDPAGATTAYTYDANGNMLTSTDAAGKVTSFEYDGMNRQTKVTDPLGNVTTYAYDKLGHRTSVTDANGVTTAYTYNYQGQVTTAKDALNNTTTYAYGATGCPSCGGGADKLTALTDAKGQATSWQYDLAGRITRETDPLAKATIFSYDAAGNLTGRTDANGATVGYVYDALRRLTGKTYPDATSLNYTYDAAGRVLTAANANVTYTYVYDAAGRMTSVTDSRGYVVGYEYDTIGNQTKTKLQPGTADEHITNYVYDSGNRLQTITSLAGTFTHGYDTRGRRTSLAYPHQVTATYTYDDANRLTGLRHAAGETTISFANYSGLDKVGNRKSKTSQSGTESYVYDPVYRLLQAITPRGAENYSYDAVGNRLTGPGAKDTGYLYNAGNQMTKGRQFAYAYDNNGNQASRAIPAVADKGWLLTWDFENRLTKMEKSKGTAEKETVIFSYDPQGRRIGKQYTVLKDGVTKTSSWSYVYDNDNIALEVYTDETGAVTKTFYTHGAGVDEHLGLERGGQFYYYHADGLGSIVAITDSNKAVIQAYEYDSFGMGKPSTGFRNSYTYTGREWDKETGLYYYRARYYDPIDGRFIQKDPIGFEGGDMNLYGYVGNSPLNRTDPTGLKWVWFCKARLGSGGSARNTVAAIYPFFGHCYIKFGDDARGFYAGATEGNWAAMQEEERTPIINRWCRPSWVSDCVYDCLKKNTAVGTLGAPYGGSSLSNNCCTNLDTKVKECTEKCCGK